MKNNFFSAEVIPWLDEIPDEYILIFTSAIAIAMGREDLAPKIDHLQKEAKELTLYTTARTKKILEKENAKVLGPADRSLN